MNEGGCVGNVAWWRARSSGVNAECSQLSHCVISHSMSWWGHNITLCDEQACFIIIFEDGVFCVMLVCLYSF